MFKGFTYYKSKMKTIQLSRTMQLIDINGSLQNFMTSIYIQNNNGKPYYISIANQTHIDNSSVTFDKIEIPVFKHSFEINDENYQNYFLVLKSDEPIELSYNITTQPIKNKSLPEEKNKVDTNKNDTIKNILYVVIFVLACLAVYFLYTNYSKGKVSTNTSNDIGNDNAKYTSSPPLDTDLLYRINNLNIN